WNPEDVTMPSRQIIALPSATRTGTTESTTFQTRRGETVNVTIDVTDLHGGTPYMVMHIEDQDRSTGQFVALISPLGRNTVGPVSLRVYPDWSWRVRCVHADGQPITYSVGANVE